MKCKLCTNECHRCSSGPFNGLRLKADYLSEFSLEGMVLDVQDTSTRQAISGVQPKVLVDINKGKLTLADNGRFILKPVPNATYRLIEQAPANEHLTMRIASVVYDIDTAANGLIEIDGKPVYITKRFDLNPDNTSKLQEDFTQLLNRSVATHGQNFKYDYSYEQFGQVVDEHFAATTITKTRLFELILFNYIVGNGDAHLKNFSGYQTELGDMVLTPAYDLLCTFLHTPQEKITALDIFEDYDTDFYLANGYPDQESFTTLATKLQVIAPEEIIQKYQGEENLNASLSMIDSSRLLDEAKEIYGKLVKDRVDVLNR